MSRVTRTWVVALMAAAAAGCASAPSSSSGSDPCSGGTYCSLNPNVSQATIGQTICVRGWTATVRPPVSYTNGLKRQQMASEGLRGSPSDYEEDHRMPLELGGAPSDAHNLSPEHPRSPNPKDSDESRLRGEVCAGQISLQDAQVQLVQKWLNPWPQYKQ